MEAAAADNEWDEWQHRLMDALLQESAALFVGRSRVSQLG